MIVTIAVEVEVVVVWMKAATVLTFSAKYGVAMACLPTLSVLGNTHGNFTFL